VTSPALAARASDLATLGSERFDVLVIGGGINGAAIARDAALRGLRVALVEREDFAAGTSSRSSRLIHGGLRYLEHGYFHLVFESSRERRLLLRLAPHLVRPLAFTWPVYDGARVPRWKLAAGLLLYDALSLFRNVARHSRLSVSGVLAREPALAPHGLRGGAMYYDAATDDTRLTLANARGAAGAGAIIVNHAPARAIHSRGDGFDIEIEDALTGQRVAVHARVIVNATGPWTDSIRRLERPDARASVRGTKGVHIAVPRERMRNRNALTLLSPVDGRVMFVLPSGTSAIIGTTDTPTEADPDDVRASERDVEYLIATANAFFPGANLERDDVISAWAGIRPLIAAGYTGGASSASREHALDWSPAGMMTVTGGKLTAYRAIAAEAVDAVLHRLGRTGTCTTDRVPLPGGDIPSLDAELARARAVIADSAVAERLVTAHGSAWKRVWVLGDTEPRMRERIIPELPYIFAEMPFAVEEEYARSLADLLVRRTHIAFETSDNGRAAARRIAAVVAPLLGWTVSAIDRELEAYGAEVRRIFAVEPADAQSS
jgi:glycerol-3-phosphate dehydrogenase